MGSLFSVPCDPPYDNVINCFKDNDIIQKYNCAMENILLFDKERSLFKSSDMMWQVGNQEKLFSFLKTQTDFNYLCILLFLNWYMKSQLDTILLTEEELKCLSDRFACMGIDFEKLNLNFQ